MTRGAQGHRQAESFMEAVNDNFWYQNLMEFTHLQTNENPCRFDFVFSKSDIELEMEHLPPVGLSKHAALCFNLFLDNIPGEQECAHSKLNYHKADKGKLRTLFRDVNWDELFKGKSVNVKYNLFSETCDKIVKECVPAYKNKQARNEPKWMNWRLQLLVMTEKEAWGRCRQKR